MTLAVIEFPNHLLRLEKVQATTDSEVLPEETTLYVVELENKSPDILSKKVEASTSLSEALFCMGRYARTLEVS